MGAKPGYAESIPSKSIMIIGSTGEGKSSLINLLVGEKVAETGDGPRGVTFQCKDFRAIYDTSCYELADTVGLNESEHGAIPHAEAIKKLLKFAVSHQQGFNSFVFVMKKGRITTSFEKNLLVFYTTLYGKQIPCILYISGCEHDEPMDQWHTTNKQHFTAFGFAAAVCGTTLEKNGETDKILKPLRYQTKDNIWKAIQEYSVPDRIPITARFSPWQKILNIMWNFFTNKPYYDISEPKDLKRILVNRGLSEDEITEIFGRLHV